MNELDIIAEIDRWKWEAEPPCVFDVMRRARDEIVALRKEREAYDTPAWEANDRLNEAVEQLKNQLDTARAEALEEAARVCDRSRDPPMAAAIRALKDKRDG